MEKKVVGNICSGILFNRHGEGKEVHVFVPREPNVETIIAKDLRKFADILHNLFRSEDTEFEFKSLPEFEIGISEFTARDFKLFDEESIKHFKMFYTGVPTECF